MQKDLPELVDKQTALKEKKRNHLFKTREHRETSWGAGRECGTEGRKDKHLFRSPDCREKAGKQKKGIFPQTLAVEKNARFTG